MTDLEASLSASVSQVSKHHEYARAAVALSRLTLAIAQLQIARTEISVTAGEQRRGVSHIDEALLSARRAYADTELVLKALCR